MCWTLIMDSVNVLAGLFSAIAAIAGLVVGWKVHKQQRDDARRNAVHQDTVLAEKVQDVIRRLIQRSKDSGGTSLEPLTPEEATIIRQLARQFSSHESEKLKAATLDFVGRSGPALNRSRQEREDLKALYRGYLDTH